jgi:hypothetical protein
VVGLEYATELSKGNDHGIEIALATMDHCLMQKKKVLAGIKNVSYLKVLLNWRDGATMGR